MTDADIGFERHPEAFGVVLALWAQSEGRRLARELTSAGVPVLLLKGPDLQVRLYGTPAAYASGDVDVLIPRRYRASAQAVLDRHGWEFSPANGVLWRLSAAATYVRDGFALDLHWGLHAGHLAASSLRSLERLLWAGAVPGSSGMLEPDAESLLVFLAVHVVGHRFERPEWSENVHACATLVTDWDRVRRMAHAARVEGALCAAMESRAAGARVPVLDGAWGRIVSEATSVARGHFLPQHIRDDVREALSLRREGFGLLARGSRIVRFAGLDLRVQSGVFVPTASSEGLARLALTAVAGRSRPLVIDVGTGSGAIAVAVAVARPDALVLATDTSGRAVANARANAVRLGVTRRVQVHRTDLFGPLRSRVEGQADAVVSNVPFVDPRSAAMPSPAGAPSSAVVGREADGLSLVRSLASDAAMVLRPGGGLVLQLAGWQWDMLSPELERLGYEVVERVPQSHSPAVLGIARIEGRSA